MTKQSTISVMDDIPTVLSNILNHILEMSLSHLDDEELVNQLNEIDTKVREVLASYKMESAIPIPTIDGACTDTIHRYSKSPQIGETCKCGRRKFP